MRIVTALQEEKTVTTRTRSNRISQVRGAISDGGPYRDGQPSYLPADKAPGGAEVAITGLSGVSEPP